MFMRILPLRPFHTYLEAIISFFCFRHTPLPSSSLYGAYTRHQIHQIPKKPTSPPPKLKGSACPPFRDSRRRYALILCNSVLYARILLHQYVARPMHRRDRPPLC